MCATGEMRRTITYPISNIIFLLAVKSNQRRRCLAARVASTNPRSSLPRRPSAPALSPFTVPFLSSPRKGSPRKRTATRRGRENGGDAEPVRRSARPPRRNQVTQIRCYFSLISRSAGNTIPSAAALRCRQRSHELACPLFSAWPSQLFPNKRARWGQTFAPAVSSARLLFPFRYSPAPRTFAPAFSKIKTLFPGTERRGRGLIGIATFAGAPYLSDKKKGTASPGTR